MSVIEVSDLVTIPNVQLVQTGIQYPVSTGKVTFTEEDLADIVLAQDDPAIVAPRIKLGHTDPRFDLNQFDGEPAFGTVQNLKLANNNQTVEGDLVGVPSWLADIIPTAFPNRSIEGNFSVETVTGKSYRFVMTDLALLGVIWPGISTLEDLKATFSKEGPDLEMPTVTAITVQAETVTDSSWDGAASRFTDQQYASSCVLDRAKCSDTWKQKPAKQRYSLPVREPDGTLNRNGVHAAAGRLGQTSACPAAKTAAAKTLIGMYKNSLKEDPPEGLTSLGAALEFAASANLEDVSRTFYDTVAQGDNFWWWIRSILIDPNEVIVDDDEGNLFRMAFVASEDGTVTFSDPSPVKIEYVDTDVAAAQAMSTCKVIATVFASSEESRPANRQGEKVAPDLELVRQLLGLPEDSTDDQINARLTEMIEAAANPPADPPEVTPPAPVIPEGMVVVDEATLQELAANALLGQQAFESQRIAARDGVLHNAVRAGKFPPARLQHWTEAWERDPEGIKAVIDSMPVGLIPVGQLGIAPATELSASAEAYPKSWLPELNRNRNNTTITQEA